MTAKNSRASLLVVVLALVSCGAGEHGCGRLKGGPQQGVGPSDGTVAADTVHADAHADAGPSPQAGATVPDMVPMPKRYQQTGGVFALDAQPIFIESGNRQCEIAADEIALRIKDLGGRPGEIKPVGDVATPGIYLLPFTSSAAKSLAAGSDLAITADDPGPQGYVINTTGDQLVIIGSDNIGTLYGAMTLRQMMQRGADGGVSIKSAEVYDKPDYHFRGTMGFDRGLRQMGGEAEDYQAGIDTMMRFKLNILSDYQYYLDPRDVGAGRRAFYRQMNDYARERGIYATRGQDTTELGNSTHDKERPEFKEWPCVQSTNHQHYFCWSRDALTRERANRQLDLIKDSGFSIFFLHPVDGGGIDDPELWSRRCDQCKQRFGDDRWKASANQYNIWAEVMREKGMDDVILTSPIYPYSAGGTRYEDCAEPDCAAKRKNSVEYWQELHKMMDSSVVPMLWLGAPDPVSKYASYFGGRPLAIYAHSIRVLGYFGTWHRQNKSNYRGNPQDILLLTGGNIGLRLTWMNQLCSVEYAWNTEAPGSEAFDGPYYDSEKDHTEPKEIIEDWVPRASRALFGKEVGDRMAPVFQVGVLPLYIETPAKGIETTNHYRRKPPDTATDPGDTKGGSQVATYISDSAARMAKQVEATRKAWAALEDAYLHIDTLDRYQRQTFMVFYRRMSLWHLLAKAHHAAKLAAEQAEQGNTAAAEETIRKGLEQLAQDRAHAASILEATSAEPNLQSIEKLQQRVDSIHNVLTLPAPE